MTAKIVHFPQPPAEPTARIIPIRDYQEPMRMPLPSAPQAALIGVLAFTAWGAAIGLGIIAWGLFWRLWALT